MILIFTLILSSFSVFAQDTSTSITPEPPSDASVQALDKITTARRGFKITYFGDVEGPSVKDPSNPFKYDDEGAASNDRTGWYHEPGLDYRLRNGLSLKVKAPFTVRSTPDDKGSNWEPDDLTFGIAKSSVVRTDNFNLYAGVSASPAMTEYSLVRQRLGDVGATLIPSYEFGSSGFKLEWVSLFKKYLYQPSENFTQRNRDARDQLRLSEFKMEFYPALLYAVTAKASAVLGGHLLYIHSRGQQDFTFTQLEDRAHIGLNYKFGPALSLRPEVRFKNPSRILAENTELGMLIFGSIE